MDDRELDAAIARAIAPYMAEVRQLKESAERVARFAEEDRHRLAVTVREDSERQAVEAAEKVVVRILRSLGIDSDDPAEFVKRMNWLVEWMDAIGSAKRHTMTVLVTTVIGGILALLWSAFKGSLLKP